MSSAPATRARFGLIIPSSNRLSEEQFNRYAPEGVHIHTTRLRMTGPDRIPLDELPTAITSAAGLLSDAKCDVIVFHCTGSSMECGLETERRIVSSIASTTGREATSTAWALVDALHALDAHTLALISPYTSNEHEVAFLNSAGFEVVRDRAMGLPGSDAFIGAPSSLWVEVTEQEADPRVDAYLLSCTNIRSIEIIADLEERLGRPVVTSNQATLWYCLRTAGLQDVIPGLGQLFRVEQTAAAPA